MRPIVLIYSHDLMFQSVKQESSLLAVRKSDNEGNPLYESLVLDEAYLPKFRELFFNAQAQVTLCLAAYMRSVPTEPIYIERQDFSKDRDFVIHLSLSDDFNLHMVKPIEDYIFNFLKDWIMYQWLETKSTNDAVLFLNKTEKYKTDLMISLSQKSILRGRKHRLF